jgi:hypothetical protein
MYTYTGDPYFTSGTHNLWVLHMSHDLHTHMFTFVCTYMHINTYSHTLAFPDRQDVTRVGKRGSTCHEQHRRLHACIHIHTHWHFHFQIDKMLQGLERGDLHAMSNIGDSKYDMSGISDLKAWAALDKTGDDEK